MTGLRGKTVVITGASSGTGAAAVRQLHAAGAIVVPVGGSAARMAPIAAELGVVSRSVDLGSFADVRRLAEELCRDLGRIDVLALNAGAILQNGRATADGVESNLQVNALGHWLLLRLLANRVEGGRVIATSSQTHIRAQVNPDALQSASGLGWHGIYARAKLVQGILLREFGRRHPATVVADFHPGAVASDIGRHLGWIGTLAALLARPFLATPDDGARRLIHLATSDDPIDGLYFEKERPAPGASQLSDHALAADLWRRAELLTGPIDPPC